MLKQSIQSHPCLTCLKETKKAHKKCIRIARQDLTI
nr:MAG TPA: hypothetical protein [Caudoviricetes sp.]